MSSELNAEVLLEQLKRDIGDEIAHFDNYGYPNSLALCAIDSTYLG